jgi:hypothetical protein
MDPALATNLLESIAEERLLVLCGAGLSMAAPSSVPSAVGVARICRERYREEVGAELDSSLGDDIEAIARYFFAGARFPFFLAKLVPWARFNTAPNAGHDALADFLACRAVPAVVTTNFDTLCEVAARDLGEPDFRAIVETDDLPVPTEHGALLKVHGCGSRSRPTTIWCREQLAEPAVRERMERFATWLGQALLGKDLLVIGFWSDWAYLSELFTENLAAVGPRTVYVVNPATTDELRRKAPALWAWASAPPVHFHHIPSPGHEFLDDLRRIWSARFVRRLMDAASPTYEALFGGPPAAAVAIDDTLDAGTLYAMRRDVTGTPTTRPVRDHTTGVPYHVAAAVLRRLLEKGASVEAHCYRWGGRKIRVVSGKGRLLSVVRAEYEGEPPPVLDVDEVVCAGAIDDPSPPSVVRGTGAGSIVRPGSKATWATHAALVAALRGP